MIAMQWVCDRVATVHFGCCKEQWLFCLGEKAYGFPLHNKSVPTFCASVWMLAAKLALICQAKFAVVA